MSRRATLVVLYPHGAHFYEIDGVLYRADNLERVNFNRQSRDPLMNNVSTRLADIAEITPETRFQGVPFLVSALVPSFTRPGDPVNTLSSVILETFPSEVRVSPLTPRQANDWVFTAPIKTYTQLAMPDLTWGIAPEETHYPRLPVRYPPADVFSVLNRLRNTRVRSPEWDNANVPLALTQFNPVANEMLNDGEIGNPIRLVLPQSQRPTRVDVELFRQQMRTMRNTGVRDENAINMFRRTFGADQDAFQAALSQIETELSLEAAPRRQRINPADAYSFRQSMRGMGMNLESAVVMFSRAFNLDRDELRAALSGVDPQPIAPVAPEPILQREISFERAGQMLSQNEIVRFIVDPFNQEGIRQGLTRVTLIGIDGREYDVEAKYDPMTNQIFPPN